MANVTDPLANSVHGTNPQNLIEYITRQKIYDSLYWKEECFGLSASDVATKATELKALGGSYGGNNKPTRFLCLTLKLLQIQPDEGIVEELLQNEDFKYVRALGAFYLRLTGRPAEIYELIEPLYNDFRKLRLRESNGWKITRMDELSDDLLTCNRYCGIALPHLPKRDVLVSAGYLDGPRRSALAPLIEEQEDENPEKLLEKMAENGNASAKVALMDRKKRQSEAAEKELKLIQKRRLVNTLNEDDQHDDRGGRLGRHDERDGRGRSSNFDNRRRHHDSFDHRPSRERYYDVNEHDQRDGTHYGDEPSRHSRREGDHSKSRKPATGEEQYGSLFKSSKKNKSDRSMERHGKTQPEADVIEHDDDYWNKQRAILGLQPLKK